MYQLTLTKMTVTCFMGFLLHILSYKINISPTKGVPQLFLTKHYSFT